jgi:glucosamine--fructose-6-phosphate aminotransferase (isomerizing)
MYLLGLWLAQAREHAGRERIAELIAELKTLPSQDRGDDRVLRRSVRAIARQPCGAGSSSISAAHRPSGLPRGRAEDEGDLLHPTDAYAAGEMKHGPIALLDESTPVVCVATDSPVLDKVLSNIAEVRARGADVIAIATEGSTQWPRSPTRRSTCPHRLDPASRSSRSPAAAPRLPRRPDSSG